jgi:branched-chain amino acid transport system permease protein
LPEFIAQTLNGLTLAGIIFLVSSGFTLVFGVMRVTNLSHGAVYLVGGYIGYSVISTTHNFFLGLAAGALAIWGGSPVTINLPGFLGQSSTLPGGIVYPNGRVFILIVAILVAAGLYYLLRRTRIGAIVRAGVDDRDMVSALGINVRRVFALVFSLGALLAGFAGVLGGTVLGLYTGGDSDILLFALAVVIVGGLGSYEGAIVGSIVIGLIDNYGTAYFPAVAYSVLFIPVIAILLVRPHGLFGRASA